MARTFLGKRPRGLLVLHKDDDPLNNRLDNLCYGTLHDNVKMAIKNGCIPRGMKRPNARLTDDDVREIRRMYAPGVITHEQIGKRFGVSGVTVFRIIHRQKWKHVL